MSENLCIRCARPMADQAYCCSNCAYRAGDQLHEIADLTPPARDVAHGFTRHGDSSASGKPGSRMPLNTMATQKLDQIQARLSTWVDKIAHGRNRPIPAPRHLGDDPIVLWARWLAGHVEWMRKTDDAERFLIEVDECVRVIRGVVRGPASQKYLGPCGAEIAHFVIAGNGMEPSDKRYECAGDVYVRGDGSVGRCGSCGAEVARGDREAWLNAEVRSHAFRAAHIAEAYGVNVNNIRTWSTRQRPDTGLPSLASWWRTEAGLITPWIEPVIDPKLKDDELTQREAEVAAEIKARGPRLHYVGDVLDLAAGDAARREGDRATRARRTAARAAESETAA